MRTVAASSQALVPAAAYIRMSTERQEDSPARQRDEITRLAERERYSIVRWYEDHGLTGTKSKNRPNFQRMLSDAGIGDFRAILVHEQSRFSRECLFDVMSHWKSLSDAGCALVTTRRGAIDFEDTGSVISGVLDVLSAREESVKIADRCVGGLRLAVKTRGQRLGSVPFGYDRQVFDAEGNLDRVVSFRERYSKPRGWRTKLVPSSEPGAVEAVKFIFDCVVEGWSVRQINIALNDWDVKPRCAESWRVFNVHMILRNLVYAGDYKIESNRGQFSRVMDEVTILKDTHEPIISREQFEQVQRILKLRHKPRGPSKPGGRSLFAGIGRCGHCGFALRWAQGAYICSTGSAVGKPKFCCVPSIKAGWLERAVLDAVSSVLKHEAREALDGVTRRVLKRPKSTDPALARRRRLEVLQKAIAKATRNIALAEDPQAIRDINKLIATWRKESQEVQETLGIGEARAAVAPEAKIALVDLSAKWERLSEADRGRLKQALQLTIKAVRLGEKGRGEDGKKGRRRHVWAEIEFQPGVSKTASTIHLDHHEIVPRRRYQAFTDHIIESYPRIVSREALRRLIACSPGFLSSELAAAINWGLIERVGAGYRARKPLKTCK